MTEAAPKPHIEFGIASAARRFDLTAQDLKLYRSWRRKSGLNREPEFLTSIHGNAVADDEVCLLGTDRRSKKIYLTINADVDMVKSWEDIKRNDLFFNTHGEDRERLRLRDGRNEYFDKSPPTAALWYSGVFNLECMVPLPVLNQLSSDFIVCGVDDLRIGIDWQFGFTEELGTSVLFGSWGVFEEDMLRGYVNNFHWLPRGKQQLLDLDEPDALPDKIFENWLNKLRGRFHGKRSI